MQCTVKVKCAGGLFKSIFLPPPTHATAYLQLATVRCIFWRLGAMLTIHYLLFTPSLTLTPS